MTTQETNMYTDIITQSIPSNFKVANIIADRNFVFVAPKDKSDILGIQINWIVSHDYILLSFAHTSGNDDQRRQIKDVSKKSLKEIMVEIESIIKDFNFADHWRGYDNWRHLYA